MATTTSILPIFPSSAIRASLTPTQRTNLNDAVSTALLTTLALPAAKRDIPACRSFIASYSEDAGHSTLEALIWRDQAPLTNAEKLIRKRALLLAENVAHSQPSFDLQTLVDLAIVYAPKHPSRVRGIFAAAIKTSPALKLSVEDALLPAFVQLLDNHNLNGLYGLRKTLHCILSFLQCAPDELVAILVKNKDLVIPLAKAYDAGLSAIAQSYGGLSALQNSSEDDWAKLWVECKVATVDIFYILMSGIIRSISQTARVNVATEADRVFDLIFAILELPSTSLHSSGPMPPTPFLNQTLLADFQHSYDLSKMLEKALQETQERDARLEVIDAALSAFTVVSSIPGRDPGALKILLHSSGAAPGIDNVGKGPSQAIDKGKGKAPAKTVAPVVESPDLDIKVAQVLDILPEHSPEYVRDLLGHPDLPYKGDAEKVIEALLEGTAPPAESIRYGQAPTVRPQETSVDEFEQYVQNRTNVFDNEVMDQTQLHTGKKNNDIGRLRDRTFIEEMKADILRRAEEMSDEEDETEQYASYDVEFEDSGGVKVIGDGEESGGEDVPGAEEEQATPSNPETVLELAYLKDPKLFDRDAITRRSKEREDLKKQTGWDNEQIEGWRIMLERDPKKKDKIQQKHEFAGNAPLDATAIPSGSHRGGSRGGRGGGGRGRGGGGGGDNKRKEKNKASRGNNNRKRGHDKKVAKAGGP